MRLFAEPARGLVNEAVLVVVDPYCAKRTVAEVEDLVPHRRRDLVGHPEGVDAAVAAVRDSALRVTGFQVLRDFEGLSGRLHDYKVDIAKSMLELCSAVGDKVLLVCSFTSTHASSDRDAIARDLRKLAMLATRRGIRVAFEGLSWGRSIENFR